MQNTNPTDHKKVFGAGFHAGIASRKGTSPEGLVGSSFHNFTEKGTINNQGRILSEVAPGKYLIQFYSFLDGRETTRKIFPLSELESWTFYPSDEEMILAYEAATNSQEFPNE